MLEKFTVAGYKNFKDPITIDFSEVRDYKFNTECVSDGLITKFIIYGKNASGKSNLGYALFDIVGVLTDNRAPNSMKGSNFSRSNLNADSDADSVSTFSYLFKIDDRHIRYSYEKNVSNTLSKETLEVSDEIVFQYDHVSKHFLVNNLTLISADSLNFEYFSDRLAVLRYIANNANLAKNSPVRTIMDYVSHMLYFRSIQDNLYMGFMTGDIDVTNWIVQQGRVKEFEAFLNAIGNIGIKLDLITNKATGEKRLVESHRYEALLFDEVASSGTKALEWLYYWSQNFQNVSLLYFDEFDAYYHFDLARKVVKFICGFPNMQTIFTTHNSYLASNEVMRPDCYLTLENGKLTSFADSTSRELREGHNLEKMLRNGEFNG